jgi:hypothetical protein
LDSLLDDWIRSLPRSLTVIAGFDPAIHHFRKTLPKRMDARVKPGRDE